jgi:kinesin family member 5
VTSAGIEGGKNLAESAQDLERTRKAIAVQLTEFENVKKSLIRDLQNRCEKVVELEVQLDELREQYNNVIRNSNSRAQQKKMAFLERNLEQLTLVQKQVSILVFFLFGRCGVVRPLAAISAGSGNKIRGADFFSFISGPC